MAMRGMVLLFVAAATGGVSKAASKDSRGARGVSKIPTKNTPPFPLAKREGGASCSGEYGIPWGCTRRLYANVTDAGGCCKACGKQKWCKFWWWRNDHAAGGSTCTMYSECMGIHPLGKAEWSKKHAAGTFQEESECGPWNETAKLGGLWKQPKTAGAFLMAKVKPKPPPEYCKRLNRDIVIKPRADPPCGGPPTCTGSDCCRPPPGAIKKKLGSVAPGWWVWGSESREDEALYYRYFCNMCHGTFVEMGGLDGLSWSNSLFFERALGWRGLLIEANPKNFPRITTNRPLAKTINKAGCPHSVGHIELFAKGAVSGDVKKVPAQVKTRWWGENWKKNIVKVPCAPLGEMLRENGITFVDFFSLDVEGSELAVLKTMDWSIPVRIWLVEMDPFNTTKNTQVREIFTKNGYRSAPKHWTTTRFSTGIVVAANEVFEHPDYVAKIGH